MVDTAHASTHLACMYPPGLHAPT